MTVADVRSSPRTYPARARLRTYRWMRSRVLLGVLSVALVLLLWQLIGNSYPYTTSNPLAVWRAGRETFVPEILPAFRQTLATFGLGFAISVFAGVPIGLLMARIRLVRLILEPYTTVLYSLPMLALFPLLIVAFGVSFNLRVSAVVLFGIFAVIINTFIGASRVDPALADVGRSFMASRSKTLTSIVFPGTLRYIFAGIRIGFGHGMIGAVVMEIEASAVGMGNLLSTDVQNLRLDKFFAVVFVLGMFSIICTLLIRAMERWATAPWNRGKLLRFGRRTVDHVGEDVLEIRRRRGLSTVRRFVQSHRTGAAASRAWAIASSRFSTALRTRTGAWTIRILTLVALIAYWNSAAQRLTSAILAQPKAVADAFYQLTFVNHEIISPLLESLRVLFSGFALAVLLGIPIGLAMGRWRTVETVLDPYVSFLYALPHVCFVPVMVVWLGFGFKFGVAYVVLSAIFPVIINTISGVRSIDPELIETGRSFCASERRIIRTIILPGATPFMLAGARLAFSVSWVGVIVSEVLSTQDGLGGLITRYSNNYRTAEMIVPILYIMVIAVVILRISTQFQPRLTPWYSED